MRFDYLRKDVAFMDIETQSCVNLRTVGHRAYIRDKSTRLLSAVFKDGDRLITWVPRCELPLSIPGELYRGVECPDAIRDLASKCWVAHNACYFDAPAWEHLVGFSPSAWQDSIHTVRQHGLPGGLDRAGQMLLGRGKDKSGSAAMKLLSFCKAVRGVPVYPVGTPPLWNEMLTYNIEDVEILAEIYRLLPIQEPELLNVDHEINQRGVYVDLAFAKHLQTTWEEFKAVSGRLAAAATKDELTEDDLRSHQKVKSWLLKQGISLTTLNRASVEQLINDPDSILGDTDNPQVALAIEVLKRRIDATKASSAKIAQLIENTDPDGRIRNVLVYHKAHTGRWAGRGVQPHNLPRGLEGLDVQGLRGKLSVSDLPSGKESDALSTLIRPIFSGNLRIADYAGIEARGVAWVARCETLLETFKNPKRDVYCEFGGTIYGRPITKKDKTERQVSKVTVLGSGYGMGHNKFGIMAKLQGVDLEAAGVTAEQCVKLYRTTYPQIPAIWKAYQQAAYLAVREGQSSVAGRCRFFMRPKCLCIELPSGRCLHYWNPRFEPRVPVWGGPPVDTLLYTSPIFDGKTLYGGLLTENIVQAICRDILAGALLRLKGVVLHVHDEIVCEDIDLRDMLAIMSTPPSWAADFPILIEGFTSPHYVKAAYSGELSLKAMNGVIL